MANAIDFTFKKEINISFWPPVHHGPLCWLDPDQSNTLINCNNAAWLGWLGYTGSNYDNYMIYIGWFTTFFIIVDPWPPNTVCPNPHHQIHCMDAAVMPRAHCSVATIIDIKGGKLLASYVQWTNSILLLPSITGSPRLVHPQSLSVSAREERTSGGNWADHDPSVKLVQK